jgi:hypothetical protein
MRSPYHGFGSALLYRPSYREVYPLSAYDSHQHSGRRGFNLLQTYLPFIIVWGHTHKLIHWRCRRWVQVGNKKEVSCLRLFLLRRPAALLGFLLLSEMAVAVAAALLYTPLTCHLTLYHNPFHSTLHCSSADTHFEWRGGVQRPIKKDVCQMFFLQTQCLSFSFLVHISFNFLPLLLYLFRFVWDFDDFFYVFCVMARH